MFGFKNARVYVEGKGIIKTNLQIDNGKFVSFQDAENLMQIKEDLIIIPGFIDEHMHGANGNDVMDATQESLHNISQAILQDGVTSFLATTMTMEQSRIINALQNVQKYQKDNYQGSNVLGVHLEGPFISEKFCGAQDPKNILKPSLENIDIFLKTSPNLIKMITLAYEECSRGIIEFLKKKEIVTSIGHSNCSSSLMKQGIKEGIHCSTHTFNAMRGIHHRDIGVVGEVLINEDIYAELIADLHHVSEDAIKLLYKCKGKDKIILVTDSMEARFLSDGNYYLGGQKVFVSNGVACLQDGTLAGSTLRMTTAINNMRKVLNISLQDAIDMATINPAKNLRIDKSKGSIALYKDADFVIVDENLKVYATFINGNLVYKGENYER